MQQEDYLIREIQRFAQFISTLLSKSARMQALMPSNDEFLQMISELQKDERTKAFLDPETSDDELQALLNAPHFEQKNIEKMAELLIAIAKNDAKNSRLYFDRARLLLNRPTETISLHRIELLDQIPV